MTKDRTQTSKEKVDEILSDALKGMTEEECFGWEEEPSISIEELEALVLVQRHKRRRKLIKYLSITAAVIMICVVGCVAVMPKLTAVEANKNKQEIVEKNNGTVIIKEKEGKDLPDDQDTVSIHEITDWDKIEEYQEDYIPDMRIPRWIPDGYEFDRVKVERFYSGIWDCEFQFETEQGEELNIRENLRDPEARVTKYSNFDRCIESKIGMIYIKEYKPDTIVGNFDNQEISLYVNGQGISEAELIRIFENLK